MSQDSRFSGSQGCNMLSFADAVDDRVLYECWLEDNCDSYGLAERFCAILEADGHKVQPALFSAIQEIWKLDLAEFCAAERMDPSADDKEWIAYCEETYAADESGCETDEERNPQLAKGGA